MARADVLPAPASRVYGGPPGRHLRPGGWWQHVAVRLVPLVCLPMVLAVVQREHCVRFGWGGSDQFWRECFSDLPAQYGLANLQTGIGGLLNGLVRLDQPVVAGSVMSALGGLVPNGLAIEQTRYYFLYWVALITLLLAITVWCTVQVLPHDLSAAAQVALSPVIVLAAVLSSDALAVALVAGAMLAWHREKVAVTGVLLGLGAMTRSYVVLVALALLMVAWRTQVLPRALRAAGIGAAVAAGIAAIFLVVEPSALVRAYTSWWQADAGYGSLWLIPSVAQAPLPSWAVSLIAIAGWGLALALGWIFTRDTPRPPTWAQTSLIVVAMALMTGKSAPVQAALWLLPLAAMSGMRWRDHLIWAGGEGLHFLAVWLYVGALTRPDRALPGPWYVVFLLVRIAAITWLVTRIWQARGGPGRGLPERGTPVRDAPHPRYMPAAGQDATAPV